MTTWPERVLVVGTGLIGTSVAMSAARSGAEVRGIDPDAEARETASRRSGITISAGLEDLEGWDPDLAIVATPVEALVPEAIACLRRWPEATVTDVGSVKASIVSGVRSAAPDAAPRFIGGHPMGGTERTGPDWASAVIVDGIVWVLTPEDADEQRVSRFEAWIGSLGARPVRMDAQRHDRLVATVSHLPQIASTALMSFAAEREAGEPEPLLLAAGGFRDLTRLAASNPHLWSQILLGNRAEVIAAIDGFVAELSQLRERIAAEDRDGVEAAFETGKRSRLSLSAKPRIRSGVAVLQVPISDSPGSLAGMTSALVGTNIEDLQIVHSAEGGGGIVHLTVAIDLAAQASDALAAAGFDVLRLA